MNKFASFWRVYVRLQYKALWMESGAAVAALYGRRNPESWAPWTVYDHGLFWRLLRDLAVLFATSLRIVVGIAVLLSMTVLLPCLVLGRALLLPLLGVIRAAWMAYRLKGAADAAER